MLRPIFMVVALVINDVVVATLLRAQPFHKCMGFECVTRFTSLADRSYTWHDTGIHYPGLDQNSGVNWTGYVVNMTSQARPMQVVIVVPGNIEVMDWATLFLVSGNNDSPRNKFGAFGQILPKAAYLAVKTRATVASLFGLASIGEVAGEPNGPRDVVDPVNDGTTENGPLNDLPMVKGVMNAMDTVTAFMAGRVVKFGVTGHGQLGSVTWMSGALDPRVKAIVPVAVKLDPPGSMTKSSQLIATGLYTRTQTTDEVEEERHNIISEYMRSILGPANYMPRLKVPKLYIMGSNDAAFSSAIDHVQTIWPTMPGHKGFFEVPNCKHDEAQMKSLLSSAAFLRGVILGLTPPAIQFAFSLDDHTIMLRQVSDHIPMNITQWYATADRSRDFSKSKWTPRKIWNDRGWSIQVDLPWECCFAGSFVQLDYAWPEEGHTYSITTPVWVVKYRRPESMWEAMMRGA